MAAIVVNPQAANKIQSLIEDPSYKEAIEQSSTYNSRLCNERRLRLPFLDSQTGVAQSHCSLWMNKRQRMPGQYPGQLYAYPAKRWRKKRRQYLLNERVYPREAHEEEINGESELHQISMIENSNTSKVESQSNDEIGSERLAALLSGGTVDETSKESWYKDYEEVNDPPDAGEIEDQDSDYEDYEETYIKKKKKKAAARGGATGRGRGRKIEKSNEDPEKPYCCEVCGTRYKTRPGLAYHYSHSHCGTGGPPPPPPPPPPSNMPVPMGMMRPDPNPSPALLAEPPPSDMNPPSRFPSMHPVGIKGDSGEQALPVPQTSLNSSSAMTMASMTNLTTQQNPATSADDPLAGQRSASGKPLANPSPYCDFCLGDHTENKKTGCSEELVSCADCGRSGHPSCLQFTDNMLASVKKYRWQCIECKSCGLCGTSDNDEQLLFCDDCDRGYHMYCLNPPLSEPPEGSWSCHLCIEEFGKK